MELSLQRQRVCVPGWGYAALETWNDLFGESSPQCVGCEWKSDRCGRLRKRIAPHSGRRDERSDREVCGLAVLGVEQPGDCRRRLLGYLCGDDPEQFRVEPRVSQEPGCSRRPSPGGSSWRFRRDTYGMSR